MALNRRDFLKMSAAGVGGALCANNAQAVQREPKQLPPEAVGMLYDCHALHRLQGLYVGVQGSQWYATRANGGSRRHVGYPD